MGSKEIASELVGIDESFARRPRRSAKWLFLAIVPWLVLPEMASARVVLVGIDGGSWNLIDPLIEKLKGGLIDLLDQAGR